jgi:hypothetical protein
MKSYYLVHLLFCHAIFFCCCSWLNTLVRARHTRFAWGYYYCCWMWREQEPVEILLFCIHKYASTLYWKIIDDPYTWTIELLVHGIPANLKSLSKKKKDFSTLYIYTHKRISLVLSLFYEKDMRNTIKRKQIKDMRKKIGEQRRWKGSYITNDS